jgi:hypothetical protein
MRDSSIALCCLLATACSAAPGSATGAEQDPAVQEQILATIDRFFVAMAERDQTTFAALLADNSSTYSQMLHEGNWLLRVRSGSAAVASLAQGSERLVETYWEPTVLHRGPIAVAWTPYHFAIDGKPSHSGVNIFNLVKIDNRWTIVNVSYTMEPIPGTGPTPPPDAALRPRSLH